MAAEMGDNATLVPNETPPVPGWLASVVLHLALLSLFLTFPAPTFAPREGAVEPLTLEASFPGAPLELSSIAVIQPPGEVAQQREMIEAMVAPDWQEAASTLTTVQESASGEAADQKPDRPPSQMGDSPNASPTDAPRLTQSSPAESAARMVSRGSAGTAQGTAITPPLAIWQPHQSQRFKAKGDHWPTAEQITDMNQVVDRFIAYDIGQLPGLEGEQALREFQMLGPEAIPSLVRGLNLSARIQFTCPVGVLSAKLVQLISQSKNNRMRDYVVANLGVGVPESAPHQQRVLQLRKYIANLATQVAQPVRDELRRRFLPISRDMVQLVETMTAISIDQLQLALRSPDPSTRLAAALGSLQRFNSLQPAEKLGLASALVDQLGKNDPATAKIVHELMVKLANGLDFGDQPSDFPAWQDYWRGVERAQLDDFAPVNDDETPRDDAERTSDDNLGMIAPG